MFKTWVLSSLSIGGALPGLVTILYGLAEVGGKTGFDKEQPELQGRLIATVNFLLWALVEHWFVYIILCIGLGAIWTVMVAEPKRAARESYTEQLERRLRGRDG